MPRTKARGCLNDANCERKCADEDSAEWSRLRQPAPAVPELRIGNLKKSELRAKRSLLRPECVRRWEAGETPGEVF